MNKFFLVHHYQTINNQTLHKMISNEHNVFCFNDQQVQVQREVSTKSEK